MVLYYIIALSGKKWDWDRADLKIVPDSEYTLIIFIAIQYM